MDRVLEMRLDFRGDIRRCPLPETPPYKDLGSSTFDIAKNVELVQELQEPIRGLAEDGL